MSFVPTKYLKYQQNIERNSSFRMWKCEKFLSSLVPLARIYIDFLNVSVLSVYCRLYVHHTISNKKETVFDCIFLCRCNLRPEYYVSETKYVYLKYQQNIEGKQPFLNVKMQTFSKLARKSRSLAYSHISSMLVFCQYTVIYSAINNKRELHWLHMHACRCILRPENIYVSEALARAYK